MKETYLSLDSSDEEREKEIVNNIVETNYKSYLSANILNLKDIHNSDEFKIKLGLILHNLADRLFRSSVVNNIYQEIKAKELGLNDNNYNKILNDIKTAFNKQLDKLFTEDNKENPITDKEYTQLFNFLFNKNIDLPKIFTLKNNISNNKVKEVLLKELQVAEINLEDIFKNPLNIELDKNSPNKFLICPQITNRNNKNKIKYLTIEEINNFNSSTIYKLPNSKLKTFIDSHVIHYKTGNVQTGIFGLGTYQEFFQKILNNETHKENIVKRIFNVVQNKEINNTLALPKELNSFAEQLAHLLFITEIQRNNATLFTAPMFLELIAKDSNYLKEEKFFPMSAKTAISQARGVTKDHADKLPNTHFMDYDISNVKKSDMLLKKEGDILTKWLKEIIGSNILDDIDQKFDVILLSKIVGNKKIDLVILKEIQNFIEDAQNIPSYPHDSLTDLEKNLSKLISSFGSRPEQYTKLFKDNLVKKTTFTKETKNLIETTYSEFQKALGKLESFLNETQAKLEDDVKEILPELLNILCAKIKEWYNIDAPEYITNTKTVEEASNQEALKDITLTFNQTISPVSLKPKLKFSLKRKGAGNEDSPSKMAKVDNDVDQSYISLIGDENFNTELDEF